MTRSDEGDNTPHRAAKGGPQQSERRGLTRALAEPLRDVTRSAVGTRSLGEAALLSDWASIAGAEFAQYCWPRRIAFPKRTERREGTLVLRVKPGQAPRVGHYEPVIVERVNAYFGYKAVARLRLEQGALPERKTTRPKPKPTLDAEESEAARREVAEVGDPDLRAALERLGRSLREG